MEQTFSQPYKHYFWKRFFLFFLPLMMVGILSEPMIIQNPFEKLEDYGEFVLFLAIYILVLGGWAAFITSMMWHIKQRKLKKRKMIKHHSKSSHRSVFSKTLFISLKWELLFKASVYLLYTLTIRISSEIIENCLPALSLQFNRIHQFCIKYLDHFRMIPL